jgi:hypothetical protein
VAELFGITVDKPFNGIFYFETLRDTTELVQNHSTTFAQIHQYDTTTRQEDEGQDLSSTGT